MEVHAVRYSKMATRLKTKLPKLTDNFMVVVIIITDKIIGFILIIEIGLFLSSAIMVLVVVVARVTITTITVTVEDM